jgi:hypothetical protein
MLAAIWQALVFQALTTCLDDQGLGETLDSLAMYLKKATAFLNQANL